MDTNNATCNEDVTTPSTIGRARHAGVGAPSFQGIIKEIGSIVTDPQSKGRHSAVRVARMNSGVDNVVGGDASNGSSSRPHGRHTRRRTTTHGSGHTAISGLRPALNGNANEAAIAIKSDGPVSVESNARIIGSASVARHVTTITSTMAAIVISFVPVTAVHAVETGSNDVDAPITEAQKIVLDDTEITVLRNADASLRYTADDLPQGAGGIMIVALESQRRYAETAFSDGNASYEDRMDAAHDLNDVVDAADMYHELREASDARNALKTIVSDADKVLNASNGRVDDENVRNALSEVIGTATGMEIGTADEYNAIASSVRTAMDNVNTAVANRDARLMAEEHARQVEAKKQAEAKRLQDEAARRYSSSINGRTYSTKSRDGSSSDSDDGGYSMVGDCYSAAECQTAIDLAGHNQVRALHTSDGSVYYEIHNNKGGARSWKSGSVTIDGQTYQLGQWQQARYNVAGKPLASQTTGKYFQTCGPDGKAWYAPIQ